jgi:hypothetical protein
MPLNTPILSPFEGGVGCQIRSIVADHRPITFSLSAKTIKASGYERRVNAGNKTAPNQVALPSKSSCNVEGIHTGHFEQRS